MSPHPWRTKQLKGLVARGSEANLGSGTNVSRLLLPEIHAGIARLTYHRGMCRHWPYAVLISALLLSLDCQKPPLHERVVVHLFRDLYSPYAHEIDHRILEFQAANPRLPSGAPIVVETYSGMDYKTALRSRFDKDIRVEAVILNDPADAAGNPGIQANLSHAVDICAAVKACPTNVPAFVPSSATGDSAAAAQQFVQALAQRQ